MDQVFDISAAMNPKGTARCQHGDMNQNMNGTACTQVQNDNHDGMVKEIKRRGGGQRNSKGKY
jgi:hypothetical protein